MIERVTFKPPSVLPLGWELHEEGEDGYSFINRRYGQGIIMSEATERDGKRWRHFSMSCRTRIPTWEELVKAKEAFLGVESKAIQIIPPRSQYVNIHPNVLHLWVCMDGDPLPDFRNEKGSI